MFVVVVHKSVPICIISVREGEKCGVQKKHRERDETACKMTDRRAQTDIQADKGIPLSRQKRGTERGDIIMTRDKKRP